MDGVARFYLDKTYQNGNKYTKYQMDVNNKMAIKYTNIFHCMTLSKYPNWDFWFENKPSGNLDHGHDQGNRPSLFENNQFCQNICT
jgi:hypothetical protein